ncbi:PAS domain S-box protein, partial [Thiomicrorhabdus sp.]|uniref:PAS domain S-box protein n=1 Tax=Thiomicrorhabdus sp. TaxID=2039724 RepID=UPI00356785BB
MVKVKMAAARLVSVSHDNSKPSRTWLLLLLLILMVPFFAIIVITNHGPEMQQQALNKLSAIAELKANQIESWLHEQDNVAKVISSNQVLLDHSKQLLNGNKTDKHTTVISDLFSAFQQLYEYDSITLMTPDKQILVKVGEGHNPSIESLRMQDKSIALQTIEHTGILFAKGHPAHLDYSIPLIDRSTPESSVIALILIHIDPNQFILPYLQHWPTPSKSGKTVLVRNDEGKIEHLTPFKGLSNENELHLNKLSNTEQHLPAAVALQNRNKGTMIGKDYRGVEVLAAYHPVDGTDWMLISKMDMDEATHSLHDLIFWLSLTTLFSVVIIGIAFVLFLQKQKQAQQLELAAEKSQTEHLLQHFFELPFIGMAILDPSHEKWIRFNPHLAEMLNYTTDELDQKRLSDILDPQHYFLLQEKFSLITNQNYNGFIQEVHLKCKDDCSILAILDVKCIRNKDGSVRFFLATIQDITEFTHLTEQNLANQNQLLTLLHTIPDLVWLKNIDGIYLNCNTRFEAFFGAKEDEIVGKTDYDFVDKETADFFREHDLNAMEQDRPTENEEWLTFADTGYKGLFSTIKTPMKDASGKVIGVLGVARDITKRKKAELHLERLTKLYSAMSQINEAIIRCSNEDELYAKICKVAVQHGGMKMAWVGIQDKDTRKIYPKAYFGEHSEYLEGLEVSTDENEPSGQGPTGIAFRENRPYWCQDFLNDSRTSAWHERGSQAGWQSSAAVPLHQNSKVIGTLNLYSDTLDAFDAPARDLLIEMATDIGFALNSFAHEKVRKKAEAEKQEVFERLKKLADRLPGMIYQYRRTPDGHGNFPFVSDAISDLFRLTTDDVINDEIKMLDLIHPDDFPAFIASVKESQHNLTPWHQEYRIQFNDGTIRWISANS